MGTFTYKIPPSLLGRLSPGHLVHVPWRYQSRVGVVMSISSTLPENLHSKVKLRSVQDILDPEPLLDGPMIRLMEFIAMYYRAPIGEVAAMAIPAGLRRAGNRVFSITEEGKESLHSLRLGAPRRLDRVLELLEATPQCSMPGEKLLKRVRGLNYDQLDQGVGEGLLSSHYELERPGIKIHEEEWVRLCKLPGPRARLGRIQEEVIELLSEHEEIRMLDVKEKIPRARPSIKSLIARGFVSMDKREAYRDPLNSAPKMIVHRHDPTIEQQAAIGAILGGETPGTPGGYQTFLLHGVTGSGKTEVYANVIRRERAEGRGALILLPEIALTPQFCGIFRGYFGDDVAVLHSGLTPGERYDAWRRLRSGEVGIAIGARSALFAPIPNLGVLIVDEEHDPSFKQGESPRYNARDAAMVLGREAQCKVILGSATPSLETFHLARTGRIHYLRMGRRVANRPLPEVEIIDMRDPDVLLDHRRGSKAEEELGRIERKTLSAPLIEAIDLTVERREQVIILLNRRGYAPFVQCGGCGHALYCRHCSVSLTFHRHTGSLHCHYCDYTRVLPKVCPKCQSPELDLLGIGTQRLVEMLRARFTGARIERLDRDAGSGRRQRILMQEFREGKIDILVGTQMVAKGHDIHNVTLVGVVMADHSLNFPDFRSAERTFQLMTQVAGRAGRGTLAGKVLIQTLTPDHYALEAASLHSYEAFIAEEIDLRHDLLYPPYSFLIAIRCEAIEPALSEDCADRIATLALADTSGAVEVLGPALAPMSKIRGKTRYQLLLKSRLRRPLRALTDSVMRIMEPELRGEYRSVRVIVDIDPLNML